MQKHFSDIVDRLKKLKGLKTDGDVALELGISKGALSNHKTRDTIPFEALYTFCDRESISLDYLLTGVGPKKRGAPEHEITASNLRSDPDLAEIAELLKEHPQDKKQVLKLLRGKKDIKEALENLKLKGFNEEPNPA